MDSTMINKETSRELQSNLGATDSTATSSNNKSSSSFIEELKDIYYAELALIASIPKMMKKASCQEIADSLAVHHNFTMQHIKRLEDIFKSIGETKLISEAKNIYNYNNTLLG